MADIIRVAHATWNGGLKDGSGSVSTETGHLKDLPFSVPSRFAAGKGTNPEELVAAAHASCFSMMLSKVLGDQGISGQIQTKATLTMGNRDGGWKVIKIHLETSVSASGLNSTTLESAANTAKEQCPISILLAPGLEEITLDAKLNG